jgi:nitroreductase
MTIAELIVSSRSCRRYQSSVAVPPGVLADLVDMARMSPSAVNAQPLRYALISDAGAREAMFSLITLGKALKPEQRPTPAQQPGGYIVMLGPEKMPEMSVIDVGIAAQTINLAANAVGLATCMILAFKEEGVASLINPPAGLKPRLVIAVGAPDEECRLTAVGEDRKVTYYRDEQGVHRVPKFSLEDVIVSRV